MNKQEFDFIADERFREILARDYSELQLCYEAKATKSVLVLSGSIIESILTEYFILFPVNNLTEKQILGATLNDLIDWAVNEKVISSKEKNLCVVIKEYRNLIHPGREIRKNEKFDFESAKIAKSVLELIIKSIRTIYLEQYGYSAKDIMDRLKKDWYYQSIFDKVILKLNHKERTTLLKELVEFEIWEKSFWECFMEEGPVIEKTTYNLENVALLVPKLKRLVPNETIKSYLKKLVKEIESGDSLTAFCLYNLFHEELNLLSKEAQETVIIYMLNFLGSVDDESRTLTYEKTYSTIGKYIKSESTRTALKELLSYCAVNFNHSAIEPQMEVLEQIFNSLTDGVKTEAEQHLTAYLEPTDKLPPYMKTFYEDATKRQMIR